MSALELDRPAIYDRVVRDLREAQVDTSGLSVDAIKFVTDSILEEMRRQYLVGTGRG